MQHQQNLRSVLGNMDIYLIDQVLKERYRNNDRLLDAGCGEGRNLAWFIQQDFDIYGVDQDEASIVNLRNDYPLLTADHWQVASLDKTNFADNFFDHIICSAVLHFAESSEHFFAMLNEMLRILQPGGSLFIRIASDVGIEKLVQQVEPEQYLLPDGSVRFLLTRKLLQQVLQQLPVTLLEPFKTVNVDDIRCMSTIVLQKK